MTTVVTVIEAHYLLRDFTEEDVEDLKRTLAEFGPARVRPFYTPAAGGGNTLAIVAAFVGAAIAQGFLQELGKNTYRRLGHALQQYADRKRARGKYPAVYSKVVLRFDNLDMTLWNPSGQHLHNMADTLYLAYDRLTSGQLACGDAVISIEMPIVDMNGSWTVQEWEDAPIEGPMVKWAITTFYHEDHRRPYDAESDSWLA